MISENQKRIYNTHLAISRKSQGEPYKLRKNFDNLKSDIVVCLEKMEIFFNSNPTVDPEIFFSAPFKIYPEKSNYTLDFFVTQKAKKVYSMYIKSMELEDPDARESLIRLQQNLKFVFKFCEEKGLTLENYPLYIEENLPCFLIHLKTHKINFYTLHALSISKINIETGILDFMFGSFYETFQKTRTKFFTSRKMREFSKQAKTKLTEKLKNNKI